MSDIYPNLNGANQNFTLQSQTGRNISLNGIKDFRSNQDTIPRNNMDKDGTRWEAHQPVGYSGSFTITKRDVTMDGVAIQNDDDWHNLRQLPYYQIFETIILPKTLETFKFIYERVSLKFDDLGDWNADRDAEVRVTFSAQARRKAN